MIPLKDYDKMKLFYDERNFWISLLGLLTWLSSWRLEVLYRKRFEVAETKVSRGLMSRLSWAAVGCGVLLLADLPLCRANYKMQLSLHVTPGKEELLPVASGCEGIFLHESEKVSGCSDFCRKVRILSEERQSCVLFARQWHLLGGGVLGFLIIFFSKMQLQQMLEKWEKIGGPTRPNPQMLLS